MIKFVGSDSGKFGTEFIDDEVISLILITMTEDDGVTKVNSIR